MNIFPPTRKFAQFKMIFGKRRMFLARRARKIEVLRPCLVDDIIDGLLNICHMSGFIIVCEASGINPLEPVNL